MTAPAVREDRAALAWFLQEDRIDRIVVILSVLALGVEAFAHALGGGHPFGYAGIAVAATGVALSRRRRALGLSIVVLGTVVAALFAEGYVVGHWTVVVFTLISVTLRGTPPIVATVLSVIPVYLSLVVRAGGNPTSALALTGASLCAAASAIGSSVRTQQRYLESIRQRALDAVATRDLAVDRGIAQERLRIARDLHDAVGHEIAVVSMNLGAAELQLQQDPEEARESIVSARGGVQRVLQETQQILNILRNDAGIDTDAVADIRNVPALVVALRAAGTSVDARLPSLYPELESAVSAAGYRIVQEALTNAQRHGAGGIRLWVRVDGDLLKIDVYNRRRLEPVSGVKGSGYGLVGMRERSASVSGRLEVLETNLEFHVVAELNINGRVIT
jgi:signal transduction histidine kinase